MILNQANYLEAMGIPVWRLRRSQAAESYTYLLFNAKAEPMAYVIASLASIEEEELLANIIKALEAQLSPISFDELGNNQSLVQISFGEALLNSNGAKQLYLPSLGAMLQDSSLKKEVWQKLRPFKAS